MDRYRNKLTIMCHCKELHKPLFYTEQNVGERTPSKPSKPRNLLPLPDCYYIEQLCPHVPKPPLRSQLLVWGMNCPLNQLVHDAKARQFTDNVVDIFRQVWSILEDGGEFVFCMNKYSDERISEMVLDLNRAMKADARFDGWTYRIEKPKNYPIFISKKDADTFDDDYLAVFTKSKKAKCFKTRTLLCRGV